MATAQPYPPEKTGHGQDQSPQVYYEPVPSPYYAEEGVEEQSVIEKDAALKQRIRILKLVSRIMATLLSIGVFVPMALTIAKFLETQNIYRDVTQPDGTTISRTAWAFDSKVWPTWLYFVVAAISVILNGTIMLAYLRGVRSANKAATVATVFTVLVTVGQIAVWVASVAIYRYEKDTNGVSDDLWGWTCSEAADSMQNVFDDVIKFEKFCKTQSAGFVVGVLQAITSILTGLVFFAMFLRLRSKKRAYKARESVRVRTGLHTT